MTAEDARTGSQNAALGDTAGMLVQARDIHGGVHHHSHEPRASVGLPYRFGDMPLRAGGFQDREAVQVLASQLDDGRGEVAAADRRVHAVVLSGLGGVGKTQVAADYAERAWQAGTVDLLVWVTAASRDQIEVDFARLATDLTGIVETDPARGARRLLNWLAGTSVRWLVVLDDLQTPKDLAGLWPPHTSIGRVVMTTRRRDAALHGLGRSVIDVGLFTAQESAAFLSAVLADRPDLADGPDALATELGHLPLALAQAAAYLRDREMSCSEYQRRFVDRRRTLASLLPDREALPDAHHTTVAASWSLSVEYANQLTPVGLAAPLLQIASLLDPNGIPAKVFTTPAIVSHLGAVAARDATAEHARDALTCLYRLNLISFDPRATHAEVRVHALVQRATRDHLTDHELAELSKVVGDALMQAWPGIERDTVLAATLRANTAALHANSDTHLWSNDCHSVLFRAGMSMGEAGHAAAALAYFDHLRTIATEQLGPYHPDTLTIRDFIAQWRGRAGDPIGAAIILEKLLEDRLQLLGPDHPSVLVTRGDLTRWRRRAGDPAAAAAAFHELLTDYQRILGPDHPDSLIIRHNIASWQAESGDVNGALAAFGQLLADRQRALGPDHPDTLTTRDSVAHWQAEFGNINEALAAFEQLLADRQRVLGPDHPDTLATRDEIAYWRILSS